MADGSLWHMNFEQTTGVALLVQIHRDCSVSDQINDYEYNGYECH